MKSTITWHSVKDDPGPLNVLVAIDGEPVAWVGSRDTYSVWRDVYGRVMTVTHWAELPRINLRNDDE
jgi:hypothetical protein